MLKKQKIENKALICLTLLGTLLSDFPFSNQRAFAQMLQSSKKVLLAVESSPNTANSLSTNSPTVTKSELPSKKQLQGEIQSSYLQGAEQIESLWADKLGKEDPDAGDQELMIEWDRWRNRFLQAVLSSTTENLNSDQAQSFQYNPDANAIESKYPLGTIAWFVCTVTNDRKVKDARIVRSSGFANYDQAVMEAIQGLSDSSLLKFPTRSKRITILEGGGIERASTPQNQYFRFGDIEHYHVPAF